MNKTKALIFSNGILQIPYLSAFLAEYQIQANRPFLPKPHADCVIGWGLRPSTQKARNYAVTKQLPYIALEDGFLRSLGLGVQGYPPLSMVVDDLGIYYDTTRPSRLEQILLTPNISAETLALAEKALGLIRRFQLSKYNHNADFSEEIDSTKSIVLVVDQTFGDMAVKYGQADESHFQQMLNTAIAENPQSEIWVKTHPDVLSGKKKGYLTELSSYHQANVRLLADDVNPLSLLAKVQKVYCVTSQLGFEALMMGKTVVTFGVPWFAGWGLTDDRNENVAILQAQQRRQSRSLLHLFAGAYLQYSRYLNPNSGTAGSIFDVIDYLSKMKTLNQRLSGDLYCVGMSLWKRSVIKPFFRFPLVRLHFIKTQKILEKQPLAASAKLLIWSQGKPELLDFAAKKQLSVLRMEDGFIRSVGLGSNLVAPLSLVVDDLGIYFNAQSPSRLEKILQEQQFSPQDLALSQQLQQRLIQSHIGKYNVGNSGFEKPQTSKRILLVTGQVEDDASIRFGSPEIQRNADLLQRVRERNPEAYILYKPHPDVVSGNRQGAIPLAQTNLWADEIVENANVLDCINYADEIHTMTSLAGFEALLRGKIVHCYGLPFYANWGLTVDELTTPRRTRRLSLDELACAVLIYYPLYVDFEKGRMINAEQAITLLEQQKAQLTNSGIQRPWLAKQFGKLVQLYRALR